MKRKILFIEDNPEIRENTIEWIELSGFDVSFATNGKEGIGKIEDGKPDLILCDIRMPETDGYQVLQAIKEKPELDGIPFIFLTAFSEETEMKKGMALGVKAYLIKPFLLDELEVLINENLPA